jgi:hypothetical protein
MFGAAELTLPRLEAASEMLAIYKKSERRATAFLVSDRPLGSRLCENSFRSPRRIANGRIGYEKSREIECTWLKLTPQNEARVFSHSLGRKGAIRRFVAPCTGIAPRTGPAKAAQ